MFTLNPTVCFSLLNLRPEQNFTTKANILSTTAKWLQYCLYFCTSEYNNNFLRSKGAQEVCNEHVLPQLADGPLNKLMFWSESGGSGLDMGLNYN